MFTTLMVPLDGSPTASRALPTAVALARRTAARLQLVTVTSPGLSIVDDELMLIEAGAVAGEVPFDIAVLQSNDVADSLAGALDADPFAILCMATHGRTGIARAALGSTAESVVRRVARPTLLVGQHAVVPERWDVVQACVDTRSTDARRTIDAGRALAEVLGARLRLTEIHPARKLVPLPEVVETSRLEAIARPLREAGVDVEWDVGHSDDVVEDLLRLQHELGAAVLIATTHGRTGISRAVMGSVTTELVHGATCPVLVVPPSPDDAGRAAS